MISSKNQYPRISASLESPDSIVWFWCTTKKPSTHNFGRKRTLVRIYVWHILYGILSLYIHTYLATWLKERECEGLCVGPPAEGWRWCWKEIENIPIGPLWYSGATMPAIGRRSTKPLNDPPRRSQCAMATLFQSRKSSCPLLLSLSLFLSRVDSRRKITPFFGINSAGRYIDDRAYGNAIAESFLTFPIPWQAIRDRWAFRGNFHELLWTSRRDFMKFLRITLHCVISIHCNIFWKKYSSLLFNIFRLIRDWLLYNDTY